MINKKIRQCLKHDTKKRILQDINTDIKPRSKQIQEKITRKYLKELEFSIRIAQCRNCEKVERHIYALIRDLIID